MAVVSSCRVDLHVKVLDRAVVERAKRRGLDALVYAPHFTRLPDVERTAERFSDDDLVVVPARELFTGSWRDRRHVLALALDEPVPDFITLDGAMAELERQNALVLVPHPEYLTVSLGPAEVAQYRELIDAIEVYNPKHLSTHNARAERLARRFDLPVFGSSYAHLRGTVGEVWTEFELDGGSVDRRAVLEAIRTRAPRRVASRDGPVHHLKRGLEVTHLLWENSLPKAARALGRRVATHPGQPTYEGRFDDVAVY